MLVLEIILTVIAWHRGWGAIALVPLVGLLAVGAFIVIIGLGMGALLVADAVFIAWMIRMCLVPRKRVTELVK